MLKVIRKLKAKTRLDKPGSKARVRAANSALLLWDVRQEACSKLPVPNQERFWNILYFLYLNQAGSRPIWIAEIADRFETSYPIISRYVQILSDADLLDIRVLTHDSIVDLSQYGKTLLEGMLDSFHNHRTATGIN